MRQTGSTTDLRAGSERMIRVHHKNMVQNRTLLNDICSLDTLCKKKTNRVQQKLFEVYYREFVPLRKEQALRFPEKLSHAFHSNGKKEKKANSYCLPPIFKQNNVNEREKFISEPLPEKYRPKILPAAFNERAEKSGSTSKRSGSGSSSSMISSMRMSPDIEEGRLKMIRNALSLTSQPPPQDEGQSRSRMLRRSFLINLRRQSKAVWEAETINKVTESKGFRNRRNSEFLLPHADSVNKCLSRASVFSRKLSIAMDDETVNSHGDVELELPLIYVHAPSFASDGTREDASQSDILQFGDYEDVLSYYSTTPDLFSEIGEEEPYEMRDSFSDDGSCTA